MTQISHVSYFIILRPGNDWAQGTTDVWDNEFLGPCSEFFVTSNNQELEIDFLLSGRDHIQVINVTSFFVFQTKVTVNIGPKQASRVVTSIPQITGFSTNLYQYFV